MVRSWFFLMGLVLAQAANADGLDFNTYLSIQRDMSEGEVLATAGRPDSVADLGSTADQLSIRAYSYLPTREQPYATTVTFLGGRVSSVERSGKLAVTGRGGALDFRTYLSIERNMAEGEVLAIAGAPDLVADQGMTKKPALLIRTYTYLATPEEPSTTTVTFVGGRVEKVERRWKF